MKKETIFEEKMLNRIGFRWHYKKKTRHSFEEIYDALKEFIVHLLKRSLVIALAGRTELTAAVAAIDSLEIHHQRMGRFLL